MERKRKRKRQKEDDMLHTSSKKRLVSVFSGKKQRKKKKYQARDIRHILISRQAKGIIVEDSTTGIFEGAQDFPGFLQ